MYQNCSHLDKKSFFYESFNKMMLEIGLENGANNSEDHCSLREKTSISEIRKLNHARFGNGTWTQ